MTGIDTNILVRYFVGDDPLQSAASQDFVDEQLKPDLPGYISSVVVAETVWVLTTRYQLGREKVAAIVDGLLGNGNLVVEHANEVAWALKAYRAGSLDFSDAFIAALATSAGCHTTITFDKQASRHVGFTLLA